MVSTPRLMQSMEKTAILSGTTASGKTGIALEFARDFSQKSGRRRIEIINADSMLVYRGMNIGTAKPTAAELASVPHHLIDLQNPDEPFTAGDFVRNTERCLTEIRSRGNAALIVGGTGFYLKALLYGLWDAPPSDPLMKERLESRTNEDLFADLRSRDELSANRIGLNDRYRLIRALELIMQSGKTLGDLQAERPSEVDPRFSLLVTDRDNEELDGRIRDRTQSMLDYGFVAEVTELREKFRGARSLGAVGYAQVNDYLDGICPPGRKLRPGILGLRDEIELATRQLVKSQRTWFRGQKSAKWFKLDQDRTALLKDLEEVYEN